MAEPEVHQDAASGRYLLRLDGRDIGEAVYEDTDEGRVFVHTAVEPELQHHGYGTQLVREALDDTRAANLKPIGRCPMVADFMAEHPEYAG